MKRSISILSLAISASLTVAGAAAAQNLIIRDARIITGTGQVIEKGSIVIQNGKIASVGPTATAPKGVATINGAGMTVMAGYIDTHRHLIAGPSDAYLKDQAADRMREMLEAGVTTVQEGGADNQAILELKRRVESGQIVGPRIITAARVEVGAAKDEAAIREGIRAAKASGFDSIAEVRYPLGAWPAKASEQETRNLGIAVDEANKVGIPLQVHAVSGAETVLAAVKVGVKKLVHTPHFTWLTDAEAKQVKGAGAWVSSCTALGAPIFGVFANDNKPRVRDGKDWPANIPQGEGRGREAGMKPVNGRTLYDNGVNYSFCTDNSYYAPAAIATELRVLNLMFSPIDLVQIMGKNSADFLDKTDRGTLEVGKLADIVVLAGNPLDGYWNLLNPKVVIKGGVVVVDKRRQAPR